MCGIAAAISIDGTYVDRPSFSNMRRILQHRGPDSCREEYLWDGSLALGFNRLSIVDLTDRSMQPLQTPDGKYSILFNGEVFNYVEIRSILKAKGYLFETDGDAEVALKSFQEWGISCFERFNGMWAIIIINHETREIICSRDRFGVKPLYYLQTKDTLYFSSEIKAFSALPEFDLKVDFRFLNWGHLNSENSSLTLFQKVKKIPPGHLMQFHQNDKTFQLNKWWDTSRYIESEVYSYEEYICQLSDLLRDSVQLRLRSDVPVAISLSSGIDSTLVAAYVSSLSEGEVVAFCQTNGGGDASDEFMLAKKTAHALGIRLKTTSIELPISQRTFLDSVWALDGSRNFGVGLFEHYRKIKESGFTVVLEGHGGDELFAGYPSYFNAYSQKSLMRADLRNWFRYSNTAREMQGQSPLSSFEEILSLMSKDSVHILRQLSGECKKHLLRHFSHSDNSFDENDSSFFAEVESRSKRLSQEIKHLDSMNKILYKEFHCGTLPPILLNFDALSMSNSLEIRSPMLDWRFVSLAFSIPSNFKFTSQLSKKILRDLMPREIPREIILNKRKLGFTGSYSWLESREMQSLIMDAISSEQFRMLMQSNYSQIRNDIQNDIRNCHYSKVARNLGNIQVAMFLEMLERQR
jgi:asparagine synthase (glutamine-hydrolysing)